MLYIVGGASRAGKSLLAERMRARHGIPWFTLDALKMSLHLGAPVLGIKSDGDDLVTANRMWPMVTALLDHIVFDGRDYLVEGVNLQPAAVRQFIDDTPQPVRACFLGYPTIDLDLKIAAVAGFTSVPTDWLHRTGIDHVRRYLTQSRALSVRLQNECAELRIPFVDTGGEFEAALAAAEWTLVGGSAVA